MPELAFQVEKAEALPFAAAPQLIFKVRIRNTPTDEQIHAVILRCQVRIEPARRSYQGGEPARLLDLFGEPSRWGQTLKSLLWTHSSIVVGPFSETTLVDVPAPCTFDFTVATTKYFDALESGEAPLLFLFSGTVFYAAADGAMQVSQIPWSAESAFRMPAAVWKETIEHYYPNSAWLCLRKDVFDRLHRYKVERGLPTWEQAIESLLSNRDKEG